MRILVTGATGTLGRAAVPALVKAGHEVRAMSREARRSADVEWAWADLAWGKGVRDAVRGVDAILHLATLARGDRRSGPIDVAGTRRLVEAARDEGVGHLAYVSVVGADHAPTGHLQDRLAAERLVMDSGLGWSVLRTTVFHQHLDRLLHGLAAFPAIPVDRTVPWQPVDTGEVAARLATLLSEGPSMKVSEYGGPRIVTTPELAGLWLEARNLRRLLVPARYPGRRYAAQRAGLFTTGALPGGRIGWREHLFPDPPAPSDDFAVEHTASPSSPATQPEIGNGLRVYGGDEGYQRQTRG